MIQPMLIIVQTKVNAPIGLVWQCWTTPDDIMQWNAASDDWHTPSATLDLREGGQFCYRMEARDGSMGFDFAGKFTRIDKPHLIETSFGGRSAVVEFRQEGDGVSIVQRFDPERANPEDMQRQGWQAILDRFARHVMRKAGER